MPVKNDEEFRAWLEEQPRAVCTAIAYRAAMRVLPLAALGVDTGKRWSDLALSVLRANLISGVASSKSTSELMIAARAAADSAAAAAARCGAIAVYQGATSAAAYAASAATGGPNDSAARAATGAAARAAAAATSNAVDYSVTRDAAFSAVDDDTDLHSDDLIHAPIEVPDEILAASASFSSGKANFLHTGGPWTFWAEWYERAMAGDPMPWQLQEKIALIPSLIWEAGPEAVAEEIARIEADYWAEHLPQAEEVVAREDGRFDVRSCVAADDSQINRIFRQIEFALDLSLKTNCGFSEMCVGFKLLRYTLDNLRDDPNSVEQNLRIARDIIVKQVASKNYDDHDALTVLVRSLSEYALELRGHHSEVRVAYEVRVQQTLREIDDETRLEVAKAMREFQQEKATGRLFNETGLDAETVESGAAVEAQATAIQRTGGRAAVARGIEKASQAAKNVDASGGYKATRIGTTGYTIVDILLKVFGG